MKLLRSLFFLICMCFTGRIYSQNWLENLKKVNSQNELSAFLSQNPLFDVEESTFFSLKDTTALAQKIFAQTVGDVVMEDSVAYKIWSEETDTALYFRVNYIYLNAKVRTKREIDSLRPSIIRQYHNGVPFPKLVEQYTMDGNPTGDLGWFHTGMMIPVFETAVRNATKGSVFMVDVPENDWFYVVLKTHTNQTSKKRLVYKITP